MENDDTLAYISRSKESDTYCLKAEKKEQFKYNISTVSEIGVTITIRIIIKISYYAF